VSIAKYLKSCGHTNKLFTIVIKAHFTQGVKAKVQLQSSIPIGAKVEIGPPRALH
jgi:hypothetical protein